MPAARFRNHPTKYILTTNLYSWKKELIESLVAWTKGRTTSRETKTARFATQAEADRAFAARCRELLSGGWIDWTPGGLKLGGHSAPVRPKAALAEKQFEAMSRELAEGLAKAAGKNRAELAAIARALKAYGELKTKLGAPALENAMHFFGVDGVGLVKRRRAALLRVKADDATFARWSSMLESCLGARKRP